MNQKKKFSVIPRLIDGELAGVVGATAVFPLDLTKTRLQNQKIGPNGEKMYKNIIDCLRKTFKSEGFFGMYKGLGVNVFLIGPEKAVKLVSNDLFRYHFTTKSGELPLIRQIAAGGLAGLLQSGVSTPMDLLKIRMQSVGAVIGKEESSKVKALTAKKITAQLLQKNGIFGLYKGAAPTIIRESGFSVIYFPLFAALRDFGTIKFNDPNETKFWWTFMCGLMSGCVSAFLLTPVDVVKTRLQAYKKTADEKEYKGILDCFLKIFRFEGVAAFFKGGLCRIMVIAPLFGIAQTVYFFKIGEYIIELKNKQ